MNTEFKIGDFVAVNWLLRFKKTRNTTYGIVLQPISSDGKAPMALIDFGCDIKWISWELLNPATEDDYIMQVLANNEEGRSLTNVLRSR